ncbi:X-Pro dipeptidase [Galdieria sulphuraria]|uniref:X-Pro dipeptidase n=1 Tax=Galdieria sulphuraria TaxID=130081 RepID=M2Y2U0_GALSU|nr:X-Pro dipeptidase [Galdieria sulphuraria]EME30134.1 X-Pro dipeptidase [Galdieria sulphuraria]|eukprot:XP_005706654.1 X-Pro dipeptidase [Galdieria sulphuraria]
MESVGMDFMKAEEKVVRLRKYLKDLQLDAFIIPSEDAHQSEYVANCDQRRQFISDFTGSAGFAVVTQQEALLWTDGRYFLQAEKELDPKVWKLMRMLEDKSMEDWLVDCFIAESPQTVRSIGMDGRFISVASFKRLERILQDKCPSCASLVLLPIGEENLVDKVWGKHKPPIPKSLVFLHSEEYAGESVKSKLARVRESMAKNHCNLLIVSALDEVAWLFNLRGSDVEYNPVFLSYAIITETQSLLFMDSSRLEKEAQQSLKEQNIQTIPYENIFQVLQEKAKDCIVWLDKNKGNMALYQVCQNAPCKKIVENPCPISWFKAVKNEKEVQGAKEAHVRDAVALITYFAWLEHQVVVEQQKPTECEAADILDSLRSKQSLFVSLSFPTISSVGSNAAIIHYRPNPKDCKRVDNEHIYLCDSGGQYRDGTTDVTRTLHFGVPSQREKECYTRVLKSHIQMDTAIFPKGTSGLALDCLTRAPLWKVGLDYRHGTGHGVGSFLNVHEGPQSISFRPSASEVALEPNMLVTDEPGYYEDGVFGIRIENVLLVKSVKTPNQFGGKPYFGFEHITFVPMENRLIDLNLLTDEELAWINRYHEECWNKVSPHLKDEKAFKWLQEKTCPLSK